MRGRGAVSNGVPTFWRYQATTQSRPSGWITSRCTRIPIWRMAGAGQGLKVSRDLRVIGELVIVTRAEAEKFLRCGDRGPRHPGQAQKNPQACGHWETNDHTIKLVSDSKFRVGLIQMACSRD